MPNEILPGAEPMSVAGGDTGVLVIHGFTGTPQSMRGLAEAFAAAGHTVELPLLPGHGTSLDDMEQTGWDDWYGAVEQAYADLAGRTRAVVVAGLSMGGTLALELALARPEVTGLVLVNPLVRVMDEGAAEALQSLVDQGVERLPSIGSDIADPDATELSYAGTPVRPQLSLVRHADTLPARLGDLRCPVLVLTSAEDHVVDPRSSDALEVIAGPLERVTLERSFHVATLDHDKGEIERRAVEFTRRVLG